jgi:hypothetical protein
VQGARQHLPANEVQLFSARTFPAYATCLTGGHDQVSLGSEFSLVLCLDGRLFGAGADNLMQLGQGQETIRV